MSVSGIVSSLVSNVVASQTQNTANNPFQKFQQEFQQLGQDLQSGNLSAAQSDFVTLQQDAPANSPLANLTSGSSSSSSSSSTQNSNPLQSAFSTLAQDLQSGNLSGAQSEYSTIQQDLQNQGQSQGAHFHHHHHGGGSGGSEVNQEFQALGQALQSGNLSSAQQAYTSLQQSFQQFAGGSGASSSQGGTSQATPSISVNA